MRRLRLSRRTFLRGSGAAGIAIGLPALDAMLDDRGLFHGIAGAQPAAMPTRLVTFFIPNGVPREQFTPATTGSGYAPTRCLEPLADHLADITIVSGLLGIGGPDSHAAGICAFATGVPGTTLGAGGPSIDRVAAAQREGETPFSALAVAVERSGTWSSNGHSSSCFVNASWVDREVPAAAERDPRALFATLFGSLPAGDPAAERRARYRRSVLDYVRGDAARLSTRLGATDRARIDAHLTGIRELERRLDALGTACTRPAEPGEAASYVARVNLQVDLLAMALACDLTRQASFMYADGGGNGGIDATVGLEGNQHEHAHAGDREWMARYSVVQLGALARFIAHLKSVPEGDGTLLDNAIVYAGTELGDGEHHTREELPAILAGRAGGRHTPGRHVRYTDAPRLARFLLTVLHLAGVEIGELGGETSPLAELIA